MKTTNPWVEHVRKYAKDNNISYACAITEAKASYVKVDKKKPTSVTKQPEPEPESETESETESENNSDIYTLSDILKENESLYHQSIAHNYNLIYEVGKFNKVSGMQTQQNRNNDLIKLKKLILVWKNTVDKYFRIKKLKSIPKRTKADDSFIKKLKNTPKYSLIDFDLTQLSMLLSQRGYSMMTLNSIIGQKVPLLIRKKLVIQALQQTEPK